MIEQLQLTLQSVATAIVDFLLLPGNVLLSALTTHFPGLSRGIGIEGDAGNLSQALVTSAVLWILFFVLLWIVWRLLKDIAREAGAVFLTLVHRASQELGNLKTALVCKFRGHVPVRRSQPTSTEPTLEFDDLDLAILASVAELGPGFTMSAPELADRIARRPAQIQQSLDKLFRIRMLDSAIGSTDGFDNYRLTDSGAQFISMWQERTAKA